MTKALALLALLATPSFAAVKPVQPDNIDRPGTYRHIPKGCTDTKPRAIILAAAVLLLASCQSREDRMWRDLQTTIEMTQPKR
jgi:hypothetical protein